MFSRRRGRQLRLDHKPIYTTCGHQHRHGLGIESVDLHRGFELRLDQKLVHGDAVIVEVAGGRSAPWVSLQTGQKPYSSFTVFRAVFRLSMASHTMLAAATSSM